MWFQLFHWSSARSSLSRLAGHVTHAPEIPKLIEFPFPDDLHVNVAERGFRTNIKYCQLANWYNCLLTVNRHILDSGRMDSSDKQRGYSGRNRWTYAFPLEGLWINATANQNCPCGQWSLKACRSIMAELDKWFESVSGWQAGWKMKLQIKFQTFPKFTLFYSGDLCVELTPSFGSIRQPKSVVIASSVNGRFADVIPNTTSLPGTAE